MPGGGGGGGAVLPYISYILKVCATPSGRVFVRFWSENGYTLCPFWSGIQYFFFLRKLRDCINVFIVSIPNE